ncbi:hypothetical protein [Candidatus Enterovibrio altilux]|uniref:hypothetical protein n=1 Tax=Candidatus Enterovibrio altilux TaxID=1927128 RepID=UPI001CC22BB7|nr:hypothetical protein [Candidatus Enterovibrio luxaltus]
MNAKKQKNNAFRELYQGVHENKFQLAIETQFNGQGELKDTQFSNYSAFPTDEKNRF